MLSLFYYDNSSRSTTKIVAFHIHIICQFQFYIAFRGLSDFKYVVFCPYSTLSFFHNFILTIYPDVVFA